MAELRPDVATFKADLRSALTTYWAGLGAVTLSNGQSVARPKIVFPNSGFSPGSAEAWVEIDYLPGTATGSGAPGSRIKQTPAVLQATVYVRENTGEELAEILADRVADMMQAASVACLHKFETDDPIGAPAAPAGYYGQVVGTAALRISQP